MKISFLNFILKRQIQEAKKLEGVAPEDEPKKISEVEAKKREEAEKKREEENKKIEEELEIKQKEQEQEQTPNVPEPIIPIQKEESPDPALIPKYGSLEILKKIQETLIQLEKSNLGEDSNTLLHAAVETQDEKLVQYLLQERQMNPNSKNANSDLPIHLSCLHDNLRIVELLIQVLFFFFKPNSILTFFFQQ